MSSAGASTSDEEGGHSDRRDGGDPIVSSESWRGPAGWSAYFPDENESDESCAGRSAVVLRLQEYFLSTHGRQALSDVPPGTYSLPMDYECMGSRSSHEGLRGVAAALRDTPDEALSMIGLAAARTEEGVMEEKGILFGVDPVVSRHNRLWPRIHNFAPLTPLRALKGNSVSKFIAVRGTVVRVSNIRQQVTSMQFTCSKCDETQKTSFFDYKYSVPTSCPTDGCRSRSFLPQRNSTETVDWQKIRIQEILDEDDESGRREQGRMPRTIDAELVSDLVDSCIPGDLVSLCGIVRVLNVDVAGNGGGGGGGSAKSTKAGKCLYYLYVEANSTKTSRKAKQTAPSSMPLLNVDEAEQADYLPFVKDILKERDPFAFLVHSAVPSIYGHELVKAGMLLSLFGGSSRDRIGSGPASAKGTVSVRRDVHCLVVGDPGLGKSQMLKAIANIAPRGVYVCGNTTTTAGLTVTVVREASGDFALEAGALVLGDRGVCCIDEFDKMGADHGALLEAMEQQSVSVAKAGILCNLSARTTVVAAANPVGGHYDHSKTVCENLKMGLPLLSRFDLVFILVDNPDEERDRFISEHVMEMFGMRRGSLSEPGVHRKATQVASANTQNQNSTETLAKRLRKYRVHDPLHPMLFRQYIAYAKANFQPQLSVGAKRVLQEFYLTLRKGAQEQDADTTPITTRQLESLVRLSEARARSVLRAEVTESDARDVIEIMRESMLDTLTDETGQVDFGRSSGMSRSRDARLFVAALHAESERSRSAVFEKSALRRVAESIGVDSGERFSTLLETINYQGYVTMKGRGRYELQSSSFSLTPSDGKRAQKAKSSFSQRGPRNGSRRPSRQSHSSSDEYE